MLLIKVDIAIAIKFDIITAGRLCQVKSPLEMINAVAPAGGCGIPSKTIAAIAVAVVKLTLICIPMKSSEIFENDKAIIVAMDCPNITCLG